MTALSLENISKSFGDVQVLRNIDLVVGTQQHPPMPETNFVNSGAVKISGAIQVENT